MCIDPASGAAPQLKWLLKKNLHPVSNLRPAAGQQPHVTNGNDFPPAGEERGREKGGGAGLFSGRAKPAGVCNFQMKHDHIYDAVLR